MSFCAAPKCTSNSWKKSKLFRFPADPERRRKWASNLKRDGWFPGPKAVLCSDHFEKSQFEQRSSSNVKKLKRNAIPTIFNVGNAPEESHLKENNQLSENEFTRKIALLEKENESLRNTIQEKDKILSSFLSEWQIAALYSDRQSIAEWDHEAITEAIKMRLNLGNKGYNYLRQTGYPLPAWRTIDRRIQKMKIKKEVDEDDIKESS